MDKKPVLVLGIGNILLKDEGFGVHVAQKMMGMDLPKYVEVMDGGTLGLDLVYAMEGREKVIVVDASVTGRPPGTIFRFHEKSLENKSGIMVGAHDFDFTYALKSNVFQGKRPEIVFICVEPAQIEEGMELSPQTEKTIPDVISIIMDEIEKFLSR